MNAMNVHKEQAEASGTWICVYKDTLGHGDDMDNLTYIRVPTQWLHDILRSEGESDIEQWFSEYTADNTDDIARRAVEEGVILDCLHAEIKQALLGKHPPLEAQIQNAALKTTEASYGFGPKATDRSNGR